MESISLGRDLSIPKKYYCVYQVTKEKTDGYMANIFENKNVYRILLGKRKTRLPRGWEN
jgi:hypothetical protein